MRIVHIDRSVPVSCDRDCGAGCPLQAHVAGGRVVRITDNPLAPERAMAAVQQGSTIRNRNNDGEVLPNT
jgi:anaerobic selenocysteine-containing dehydrogenase